jgi:amino acid transporter
VAAHRDRHRRHHRRRHLLVGRSGGDVPKAGSAYTYGYVVLGESVGWFIGWDLLLEYTAIVAVVGIGISGYFGFLVDQLGLNLPEWMLGAPGSDPDQPGRVSARAAIERTNALALFPRLGRR